MENDTDNKSLEFKVFGMTIERFSIAYGFFLFFWGVVISFLSGSNSFTSYIPSLLGLPIIVLSFFSIKFENTKRILMHIVVVFGVVIFVGGTDFIRSSLGGTAFQNLWADISKLMMLITGLFFTYQCVKSFRHSRKIKNLND